MSDKRNQTLAGSFELAARTLEWLEQQEITAKPEYYRLAYEKQINDSSLIANQLARLKELKGEELEQSLSQLYRQHFGHDDSEDLESFRQALNEVVNQAIKATAGTGVELSQYAHHLSQSSEQLGQNFDDLSLVRNLVEQLVSETQRMDSTVKDLEANLNSATGQIDELKQQYDQIRNEIFTDPLTGVLNRRGLDTTIARVLSDSQANGPHALLMVDLDNFKPLNDHHGHVVGDQILCFIAKTLKKAVRGSDAVGRYGGDEFAVFLPNTSLEGGVRVAENIIAALRKSQLKRRSNGELLGKITASIGVATSQPEDSPEQLFERADRALYQAKGAGKDSVASAT
ncbi:MAG TPA: diguanylate cyclase [Motiliproteus sp.]